MIKVLTIIGTRPEVIKMAPVIKEIESRGECFKSRVVVTGQHLEMCKPYLKLFSIAPDHDLSIMAENQTLNSIVVKILERFPEVLEEFKPDIVLVQGDTTSAFASALSAFHQKIRVGHVEAGLRTFNKYNPFPEEMNRHLISSLSDLHFAPTKRGESNLIAEGIPKEKIYVTGNTVIDALKMVVKENYCFENEKLRNIDFDKNRVICVTTHRRESFGEPLQNTLKALKKIIERFPDVEAVFPVHYNPNVRKLVYDELGKSDRIHLIEPLSYEPFVQLMNRSYMVLTDSGGIQEEAPSLGKPVLVLRETTERPEGIEAGTAKMVGTDMEKIISAATELLENKKSYHKMAHAVNPYGDGNAAVRIVDTLIRL